jgi:hypothetical protein
MAASVMAAKEKRIVPRHVIAYMLSVPIGRREAPLGIGLV